MDNIKKLQILFIEALQEAKRVWEQKEEKEMEKAQTVKTGQPITLRGYGIIGPNGEDNGKRFIRKEDAEKYLKQLKRNKPDRE